MRTEEAGSGVDIQRVAEIWGEGPPVDRNDILELCIPVVRKRQMVDLFRAHGYNVVVVPRPLWGGIKEGDEVVEQQYTSPPSTTPDSLVSPAPTRTMNTINAIYTDYEAKVREARRLFENEDTIVLYRVGDFDQIFSIEDGLVDIHALAERMNTLVCKFDGANPIVSRDNFLMMGWPAACNDRMVSRLRAHGYSVVGIKKGDTHFAQYPESTPGEEAPVHAPTPPTMNVKYNKYTDYETKVLDARARFGPNTHVVYQIGDFYQMMSIEDGLVDIHRLASILDAQIVKLDRQNPIVSRDNYLIMGWPLQHNDRMVARLRAQAYNVVVVHRGSRAMMDVAVEERAEDVYLTDAKTSIWCRRYTYYENKLLEAKRRWGEKAVVVYNVGDFYNIMSIEDGLVDICVLAALLGCLIVRSDMTNPTVSRANYLMIGWTIPHNDRMVATLRAHDYHVVMMPGDM